MNIVKIIIVFSLGRELKITEKKMTDVKVTDKTVSWDGRRLKRSQLNRLYVGMISPHWSRMSWYCFEDDITIQRELAITWFADRLERQLETMREEIETIEACQIQVLKL